MSAMRQPDCLVVGSGIAGVCAALFIQRTGARVAIVDPDGPGTGASFGNAGIVVNTKTRPVFAGLTPQSLFGMLRDPASPLNVRWSQFLGMTPWFMRMLRNANATDVARITAALASLSRAGERTYAGLWEEAGMDDLVRARGSLALNRTVEERDRDWEGPLAPYRAAGVPMRKVDAADISGLAPTGPRYAAGVYSPDFQHTVSPVGFVARLFETADMTADGQCPGGDPQKVSRLAFGRQGVGVGKSVFRGAEHARVLRDIHCDHPRLRRTIAFHRVSFGYLSFLLFLF